MAAAMLRRTRWTILLSLNAAAILIAGILIASALSNGGGLEFSVVGEASNDIDDDLKAANLIDPATNILEPMKSDEKSDTQYKVEAKSWISGDKVPNGELWNEDSITMYVTGDIDICVGGGLSNLGNMYWQTSNTDVIAGFYTGARTWLGYSSETCRYPKVVGSGTTTITAGTYDGRRRDQITVTVIEVPEVQWKQDVLNLVNKERRKLGIKELTWGGTCENAANTRAKESVTSYSHTRPDGSAWSTACPIPKDGGYSGENLMAGNAAPSPETVVAAWMASEAHRNNILNSNYTKLAVGFVYDPDSKYKTYWSQYFSSY